MTSIDPRLELAVLRLANREGLLSPEQLEVALDSSPRESRPPGELPSRLRRLVEAGSLSRSDVDALLSRVQQALDSEPATEIERPISAGFPDGGTQEPTSAESDESQKIPGGFELPPHLREWRRFRIHSRLGRGGMGDVFRAYDPQLRRYVAVKFLQDQDPDSVRRFRREAEAQARVQHPNVCKVYDTGEVGGFPYIAMQEIEGETLSRVAPALSVEQKVALMEQVAAGVHAAHRIGLIHRDMKPSNVLVERRARGDLHPYVVDFGLARDLAAPSGLTVTGAVSGTPGYMSPEQAAGERGVDRRSDVYGLGAILFELLAGRPLVQAQNFAEALVMVIRDEPPSLRRLVPGIPPDLATIVAKCLEKDPARRYDSARALAEDLRRYLDGEPIAARRASLAYRLRKRLAKNPAFSIAAGLGLVVALVLGLAAARAQLQADRRAALAQRFGRQVEEMESLMRLAEMLPRHDLTGQRAQLRQRMGVIERDMERLGRLAQGPGHYALGRGALTLDDVTEARVHLETARRLGEDTPELRLALADTLAALYQRRVVAAGRIEPSEARQRARAEARRELLEPALAELTDVAEAELSSLIAAKRAFYDEAYETAIEEARRAFEVAPWRYEAKQLEGQILSAVAQEAYESGEYAEADRRLTEAGEALLAAIEIARSSREAYLEDCLRWELLLRVRSSQGRLQPAAIASGLTACDRALETDPQSARAFEGRAAVLLRLADDRMRAGESPEQAISESLDTLGRALAHAPGQPSLHQARGRAFELRARWRRSRGEDPTPDLTESEAALRRALELSPSSALLHNTLGNSLLTRARYERSRGLDGRETTREAVASYHRAVELWPDLAAGWSNLGAARVALAEGEMERGGDPQATLISAVEAFDRALLLNSSHAATHNNRGNVFLTLADYQLDAGVDPSAAISQATASYALALGHRPGYAYAHYNVAFAYRLEATWAVRQEEDPTPAVDAARRALADAIEANPRDADNYLEAGRIELLGARWRLLSGLSAADPLAAAAAAVDRGLLLNAEQAELHRERAELARWRLAAADRLDRAVLDEGLAAAEQSLKIRPGYPEGLVTWAILVERASREATGSEADRLRRQAAAALDEAVSSKPLLEAEARDLRRRLRAAEVEVAAVEG